MSITVDEPSRLGSQPAAASAVCSAANAASSTRPRRATCASCASVRSKSPTTTTSIRATISRALDRARAAHAVALSGAAADRRRPGRRHARGLHAAGPSRQPGQACSACGTCGSRTTRSIRRSRSRTGRSRSPAPKRASSASTILSCASTGNLAGSVAAHAAKAGMRACIFIPGRPRASQDRRRRDLRADHHRRRRQLRRRQSPVQRDRRPVRQLGVRQHQPAPVLLGRLEDAGLRGCRAARLAAARPCRRADRQRLDVHQDPQGFRRAAEGRPGRAGHGQDDRRAGRGVFARRPGGARRHATTCARSSPTRSPRAWRSAIRPTATTRSRSSRRRAARSTR